MTQITYNCYCNRVCERLSAQKAECRRVKEAFINYNFVNDLKSALQILIPIDRLIVKYQSDKVPVSEVLPDFHALPEEFQRLYAANFVTEDELNYLVMLTAKCIPFYVWCGSCLKLQARSAQSWSWPVCTITPQSGKYSL
jgi:hypothetical protein